MVVMFILLQMWQYRRPRKLVRKWMQYSGSALGLGVASGWLVSHSRLSGSNDLDRWFQEGVETSSSFLKEHIQQPVTSLLNYRLSLHCCFSKS
jgi:nuclear-control-of-ATPase protein 2